MGTWNIDLKRGETLDRTLVWKKADGTARDLTGYAFTMKILKDDGTELITLSSTGGSPAITFVDAPAGTFRIKVPAATTAGWTITKGQFDLKAQDPGGTVSFPLEGILVLTPAVTS